MLILANSRGKKSSLKKMHFIGHALRTPDSRERAAAVLAGTAPSGTYIVRVEPGVSRALDFGSGAGLLSQEKGRFFRLTDEGLRVARAIQEDTELLREEKAFLNAVRTLATEQRIRDLLARGGDLAL
ncbi:MAG TPA: hypothetical protein VHG28_13285 [Longimicrobiaceae bacterium]|nr:hypothetical protein [Longimicrobiaceae bacterium]